MQDAWRAYLELALGVTEASRKKAQKAAQKLVGKGGATASQLQAMTEDLLSAGSANREGMIKLVRAEVERALGKLGLASAEEVAALAARVRDLEDELSDARARASAAEASAAVARSTVAAGAPGSDDSLEELRATMEAPVPAASPVKKAVVKKATAKKAVAKKAVSAAPAQTAVDTEGDAPAPAAAPAKSTGVKKATAKTTTAKTAAPRKTAAKKTAPAKKTIPAKSGGDGR